jgi:cobaltochelatase CobS
MEMQPLTKLSVRTIRRPCRYCGTTDLYAARTEAGKTVVVDAVQARDVAMGQTFYGAAHYLTCPVRPARETENDPISDMIEEMQAPPRDQELYEFNNRVQAEANATPKKHDDRLAILESLLSSGPSESDVRTWINDAMAKQDRPERIITIHEHNDIRLELDGHNHAKQSVVIRLLARGLQPMLVGPAGTGKSKIAELAAKALDLSFGFISCTPTPMVEVEIFGFMGPTGYVETDVYRAVKDGGLMLFDEADKCHPGVFAKCNALFAATPGDKVKFPCGMIEVAKGFKAMIAANTYATGPDATYVGSNKLDGATVDRFTTVFIDYDEKLETQLCRATGATEENIQAILTVVRHGRKEAAKRGLAVILGMRSALIACQMIAGEDPFSAEEVSEMAIQRGISSTDWQSLSMPKLVLS